MAVPDGPLDVRATHDVDLLAASALPEAALDALRAAGYSVERRPAGEDDPVAGLLRLERTASAGPVQVDLILAGSAPDREALARPVALDFGGWTVPVLAAEDLVAMKLATGGPLDLADARRILAAAGSKLDRARLEAACARRRVGALLKDLLPSDPF